MNHSDNIKNELTAMEKITNIFIVFMIILFGAVVSLLAIGAVEFFKAVAK